MLPIITMPEFTVTKNSDFFPINAISGFPSIVFTFFYNEVHETIVQF